MINTCSCLSCNGTPLALTRQMTVLGHPLTVRNLHCSDNGKPCEPYPEHRKMMLTILITEWCPAQCPFCIAGEHSGKKKVDIRQLEKVLHALKAEDALEYISISGGEPMADPVLLDEVLCLIYEIFGTELMVGITSNGLNLDKIHTLRHLMDLDRFRISRHHWDDKRNQELFGIQVPSATELRSLISGTEADDLFALNCLLLRDWVGTFEAFRHQLDFIGELGPALAAFISPSPVTAFAREQRIDFFDILRQDPNIMLTNNYRDSDICRCQDGVAVTTSGRVVEFYGRVTNAGDNSIVRGLVYGADNHLRAGYDGEIIFSPGKVEL